MHCRMYGTERGASRRLRVPRDDADLDGRQTGACEQQESACLVDHSPWLSHETWHTLPQGCAACNVCKPTVIQHNLSNFPAFQLDTHTFSPALLSQQARLHAERLQTAAQTQAKPTQRTVRNSNMRPLCNFQQSHTWQDPSQ